MRVDPKDGTCRSCDGTLKNTHADDATMTVECDACGVSYLVETDAFGDGCMTYHPELMAERLARGDARDE